jgi:prevent-host-death family protein
MLGNMTVTAEVGTQQLADLVKQVQAGDEVLLTQGNKPVAKIVSASGNGNSSAPRSLSSARHDHVLRLAQQPPNLADNHFQ